jgi:hypothetical protein
MEAGGERTETRTCSREQCTTTEVSWSTDTSQSVPDIFYPPLTNQSSSPPITEKKHHKHRNLHHRNSVLKGLEMNSSVVNVSEWGPGKIHEQALSGEGECSQTTVIITDWN